MLAVGVLAAWLSGTLADRLGRRVGEGLSSGIAVLLPPPPTLPPRCELAPDHAPAAPPSLVTPAASARALTGGGDPRSRRAAAPGAPAPRRGLHVSADAVLRLARSGARPRGVPVPAEGARPAGILLQDVGGLGVGLQDGDVLTMAGGAPSLAPSDVVGMVIAARGRRAALIGGQFWRDGEPWNLVVEQPYPDPSAREDPVAPPGASAVEGRTDVAAGADDRSRGRLTTAPIAAK